jgi:hypothetical protein
VDANTLTRPRHLRPDESAYSLEVRARSWLAVNCAYCHLAALPAPVPERLGRPQPRSVLAELQRH